MIEFVCIARPVRIALRVAMVTALSQGPNVFTFQNNAMLRIELKGIRNAETW